MARISIATDDFNRAGPALGANWANLNTGTAGDIQIDSTIRIKNQFGLQATNESGAARWVGAGTFADDQYASIKLLTPLAGAGNNEWVGVIARASSDTGASRDYFEAYVRGDSVSTPDTVIAMRVNGTRTQLVAAAQAWAANDFLSLEVTGQSPNITLALCRNGVALGGGFTLTGQTGPNSGAPGVMAAGSTNFGDDWEGGSLTTVVPPIPHTNYQLGPLLAQ